MGTGSPGTLQSGGEPHGQDVPLRGGPTGGTQSHKGGAGVGIVLAATAFVPWLPAEQSKVSRLPPPGPSSLPPGTSPFRRVLAARSLFQERGEARRSSRACCTPLPGGFSLLGAQKPKLFQGFGPTTTKTHRFPEDPASGPVLPLCHGHCGSHSLLFQPRPPPPARPAGPAGPEQDERRVHGRGTGCPGTHSQCRPVCSR